MTHLSSTIQSGGGSPRWIGFMQPVEGLYLALMLRWEKNAPPDGCWGELDGTPACNSQKARMADLLRKIGVGDERRVFPVLKRYSTRRDGRSYISRDTSWMEDPTHILDDWYLEGCTSLKQKQDILQQLTKLGFSPAFVACADDFVAGLSVTGYIPSEEEQRRIIRDYEEKHGPLNDEVDG